MRVAANAEPVQHRSGENYQIDIQRRPMVGVRPHHGRNCNEDEKLQIDQAVPPPIPPSQRHAGQAQNQDRRKRLSWKTCTADLRNGALERSVHNSVPSDLLGCQPTDLLQAPPWTSACTIFDLPEARTALIRVPSRTAG